MLTEEEKNAGLEGKIIPINIEEQMKSAYIDYSMSVITARALPDVRDGLKPGHRRILYAMTEAINLRSARNTLSKQVGMLMGQAKKDPSKLAEAEAVKAQVKADAETLRKAMAACDDPILSLALNLAFSCSLRIGEMLGLTWDCIDIAPQSIENGSAYIFVNKELQRVTRGALDDLSDKGVIKKFPPCIASTHTALVLKEPKTKTSIRRVYLPKTVAYMLVERKKEIDELMDLF